MRLKIKELHVFYFCLSVLIIMLYIINPNFLGYNLRATCNLLLAVILVLQMGKILWLDGKSKKRDSYFELRQFIDILIPVVGLFLGVSPMN